MKKQFIIFILTFFNLNVGITKFMEYSNHGVIFLYPEESTISEYVDKSEINITLKLKNSVIIRIIVPKLFNSLMDFAKNYSYTSKQNLSNYNLSKSKIEIINKAKSGHVEEILENFKIKIFFSTTNMFRHYFLKCQNDKNIVIIVQGKFDVYNETLNNLEPILKSVQVDE